MITYGFTYDHGKKVIRIFSQARNSRGQLYGRYISQGTQPHQIRARNKKNLQFHWIKRGVMVFAPAVNHPGTRRNEFLKIALQQAFNR